MLKAVWSGVMNLPRAGYVVGYHKPAVWATNRSWISRSARFVSASPQGSNLVPEVEAVVEQVQLGHYNNHGPGPPNLIGLHQYWFSIPCPGFAKVALEHEGQCRHNSSPRSHPMRLASTTLSQRTRGSTSAI